MTDRARISKDLEELILAVGYCKSREEEENIMLEEMQLLKEDLRIPNATPQTLAERMIRALYVHLLGFEPSLAFVSAINLSQHSNLRVKRLGYLICCMCIPPDSQLLILLVSSLQRDLVSHDPLCVSVALTALAKLSTTTMMHALVDVVIQLLKHQLPLIRSKAAAVLQKFSSMDPALAARVEPQIQKLFLGDDLVCLMSALNFYEMLFRKESDLKRYKSLVKPLSFVIRDLATKFYPKEDEYCQYPAPWVHMQAMKVMGIIGSSDPTMSIQVANVLLDALRKATNQQPLSAIGHALVYQIHLTAVRVEGCDMVLRRSCGLLSNFFETGANNNYIFAGVTGLMKSSRTQPEAVLRHQLKVLSFLDDSDVTLRNGTLKVLACITRRENVQAVCEKLLTVVPKLQEDNMKQELMQTIAKIANELGSDIIWKFDVCIQLLRLQQKSTDWTKALSTRVIRGLHAMRESQPEVVLHVLKTCTTTILQDAEDLPSDLLKTAIWTIGEFSRRLSQSTAADLFEYLASLLSVQFEDSTVTHWLLTALGKMHALPLSADFKAQLSGCASAADEDIQQRCYEFARVSLHPDAPRLSPASLDFDCGKELEFLEEFSRTQERKETRACQSDSVKSVGKRLDARTPQAEWNFSYGKSIAPNLSYTAIAQDKVTQGTGSNTLLGNLWGYFARPL